MKRAKSGGLGRVLDDILDVLARHGEVTISAQVSGRVFEVRVQDGASGVQSTPARGARGAGAGPSGPSAEAVFAALAAIPVGLTLEDLAKQLGVRPRNKLKPVLAELTRAGKIKKVGRKHRSTSAVVRRGRKPGAGAARKRGRPGRKAGRPAKAAAAPAAPKAARRGRKTGRKAGRKAAPRVAVKVASKPAKPSKGAKSNVVKNRRGMQRRARMLDGADSPTERTPGVPSDESAS
jgi:hypothetical protein